MRSVGFVVGEKQNARQKLLLTGGGRCNLTNNIFDNRAMLAKYKNSNQFLFSAFSQFGVKDTLKFFNERGVATKEETEGEFSGFQQSAVCFGRAGSIYERRRSGDAKGATVDYISINKLTKISVSG